MLHGRKMEKMIGSDSYTSKFFSIGMSERAPTKCNAASSIKPVFMARFLKKPACRGKKCFIQVIMSLQLYMLSSKTSSSTFMKPKKSPGCVRHSWKRCRINRRFGVGFLLLIFFMTAIPLRAKAQSPSIFAAQVPTSSRMTLAQPVESPELTSSQPTDKMPESDVPILQTPIPTSPSPATPLSSSAQPTMVPSVSKFPSPTPTFGPTSTPFPSHEPSSIPTLAPTDTPSRQPTAEPSFTEPMIATAKFRQKFTVGDGRDFTLAEILLFEGLYRSYTKFFSLGEDRIETVCNFLSQELLEGRRLVLRRPASTSRKLQSLVFVEVDYTMSYQSIYSNVTSYPLEFQTYVNQNKETIASQMRLLGLNVTEASVASRIIVRPDPTPAPTVTRTPTNLPTMEPSTSEKPSVMPSLTPTKTPTTSPSNMPSYLPSQNPSPRGVFVFSMVTIGVFVVAGSIFLIGLFYYRKRRLLRELEFRSNAAGNVVKNGVRPSNGEGSWNTVVQPSKPFHDTFRPLDISNQPSAQRKINYNGNSEALDTPGAMVSPSESLVSNQSLLSAGNSMAGDSGDEADATQNLADEFDQYKDQNLEKMRSDVEGNLTGFDGMMSQALTRALMDDDDANIDPQELLWGGYGKLRGAEIEASALGEVTDWLKRKQGASVEER